MKEVSDAIPRDHLTADAATVSGCSAPSPAGQRCDLSVGFTGSRDGVTLMQRAAMRVWFECTKPAYFHHGDCVGADEAAQQLAKLHYCFLTAHPGAVPKQLRAFTTGNNVIRALKPPLARNDEILDESDELLAAPSGPEQLRSGTWSTIRKARRRGLKITLIWPDGSITVEGAQPAVSESTDEHHANGLPPKTPSPRPT